MASRVRERGRRQVHRDRDQRHARRAGAPAGGARPDVRGAARAGRDQGRRLRRRCGVSFGGSSVAENTVYINGLNVTDFYNRIGFSVGAVRVLQGVPGQDRRLLGGVRPHHRRRHQCRDPLGHQRIRVRRRSRVGAELPAGQEDRNQPPASSASTTSTTARTRRRTPPARSSRTSCSSSRCTRPATTTPSTPTTPASASTTRKRTTASGARRSTGRSTTSNLLELLAFSDENQTRDATATASILPPASAARLREPPLRRPTAATNWAATYTAYLTDNLSAEGAVRRERAAVLALQPERHRLQPHPRPARRLGDRRRLHLEPQHRRRATDTREAARLDFEWALGDHQLRFGLDHETQHLGSQPVLSGRRPAAVRDVRRVTGRDDGERRAPPGRRARSTCARARTKSPATSRRSTRLTTSKTTGRSPTTWCSTRACASRRSTTRTPKATATSRWTT